MAKIELAGAKAATDEIKPSPSKVFATRLRELRDRRGWSQTELAERLNDEGRRMSKAAVLRIESGDRQITLDEAIAFATVLHAVPMHMLSPDDGELVWLTETRGYDGDALRNWIRFGAPFSGATHAGKREELRADLELTVVQYAQAVADAAAGRDKAGLRDAINALATTAVRHRDELKKLEEGVDHAG